MYIAIVIQYIVYNVIITFKGSVTHTSEFNSTSITVLWTSPPAQTEEITIR